MVVPVVGQDIKEHLPESPEEVLVIFCQDFDDFEKLFIVHGGNSEIDMEHVAKSVDMISLILDSVESPDTKKLIA